MNNVVFSNWNTFEIRTGTRIATTVQARFASGLQWSPAGSAVELCSEAQAMPLGGFALSRNDKRGNLSRNDKRGKLSRNSQFTTLTSQLRVRCPPCLHEYHTCIFP